MGYLSQRRTTRKRMQRRAQSCTEISEKASIFQVYKFRWAPHTYTHAQPVCARQESSTQGSSTVMTMYRLYPRESELASTKLYAR